MTIPTQQLGIGIVERDVGVIGSRVEGFNRFAGHPVLFGRHKIGCVPVVDEAGTVAGIVTESDLLAHAYLSD